MSFIKVYIHFVWSTKHKISFLAIKEVRKIIWNHVRANANKNGIHLDFINGYSDHYHCLIALEEGKTIEKVMTVLKGEKTFLINKKGVSTESFPPELPPIQEMSKSKKLEWNDYYFVIAVSESIFKRINNCVQNELVDDSKKVVKKGYTEYLIQYGFQKLVAK